MICPHGIAFSREREEIYVSDKWRHCIFIFSKAGEFLRFIGSKGDMEGYLR
jgi:tripartite motif-containing protein 2/3